MSNTKNGHWTIFHFVTRQKDNARNISLEEFDIPDNIDDADLKDEKIELLGLIAQFLSIIPNLIVCFFNELKR